MGTEPPPSRISLFDPRQLGSTFVHRPELNQLRTLFETRGVRGVLITGNGGVGKSTLAHMFANQATDLFPGGYDYFDAPLENVPPREIHFRPRIDPTSRALMIVDYADSVPAEKLETYMQRNWNHKLIAVTRKPIEVPGNFGILRLRGLNENEYFDLAIKLMAALGLSDYDRRGVAELHRRTEGKPVYLKLAIEFFKDQRFGSIDDLLQNLRNFQSPGLLGPDGRPMSRASQGKLIVEIRNANKEILRQLQARPELVLELSSRNFEEVVAEILKDMGFEVELTPPSKDGGFDMYAARKDGLGTLLYLVECKRFTPPNKVGIEIVRSLNGILQPNRANSGVIVTTSYFTSPAIEFQKAIEHQMHLHDYIAFKKWLSDFPRKR